MAHCHQTAYTIATLGFQGAHSSGYMGLAATMWVPMGAQVPLLSLNDHPYGIQGATEGFWKKSNFGISSGVIKEPTH